MGTEMAMQADVPAWPCDPIENQKGTSRRRGCPSGQGSVAASRDGNDFR
jgi:hypothetical protein